MIDNKTSKVFRGIAILMVIASHYAGWMFVEPQIPALKEWISDWGVYGVDIFFLLSGYGLVKSYNKNGIDKKFVISRIMNSYVPYLIIVVIFEMMDRNIGSLKGVIKLLIGYDFWFMCVLFAFYAMFMLFYRFGGVLKEILLTLGVFGFSYYLYLQPEIQDFWYLSNAAFLIGVYLATLEGKFLSKVFSAVMGIKTVVIMAIFGAIYYYLRIHGFEQIFGVHLAISIVFTLLVAILCVQFKWDSKFFAVLGRFSLYIYLLHTRLFWMLVSCKEEWNYYQGTLFAASVTIVASVVIGFIIEFCLKKVAGVLLGASKKIE